MSVLIVLTLPLIGIGLCLVIARRGPPPDDRNNVQTTDSPSEQVSKMVPRRTRYVREDGIWYRHKAVSHGAVKLEVKERV